MMSFVPSSKKMENIKAEANDALLFSGSFSAANSKNLALHRNSHTISKLIMKPKIRIVHIVAPEVIKTDVENFRDLVQKLTGKSADLHHQAKGRSIKKRSRSVLPPKGMISKSSSINCSKLWADHHLQPNHDQAHQGIQFLQGAPKIEYMYKEDQGSSHGIFGGFGDINLVQDHLSEFPLLPLKSSIINMFGHEMPLC